MQQSNNSWYCTENIALTNSSKVDRTTADDSDIYAHTHTHTHHFIEMLQEAL